MINLHLGMTNLFSLLAAITPEQVNDIKEAANALFLGTLPPTTIDNFIHTLNYMPQWVVAGVTVFAGTVAATGLVLRLAKLTGPWAVWISAGLVVCAMTAGIIAAIQEYQNPGKWVPPIPPPPPSITMADIKVSYIETDTTWKCHTEFVVKDGSDKQTFETDIRREKIDEFGKALTEKSAEWFGKYKEKNPEFNVLLRKEPFPGEQILERTEEAFRTAAKGINLPDGRLKTMRVKDNSPQWQSKP
ncbi:MAG: hypothetical protein LBT46_10200 [Planctomycetaceae bacterium]|jgi:hypothetical protein|nr:hypothetical protein [Planctomycetaceae bacterium]